MKATEAQKALDRLEATYDKYESAKGDVEEMLASSVKFDFYIQYQPSDGHCLGDADCGNLAPLTDCVAFIIKHKKLTFKDFRTLTI